MSQNINCCETGGMTNRTYQQHCRIAALWLEDEVLDGGFGHTLRHVGTWLEANPVPPLPTIVLSPDRHPVGQGHPFLPWGFALLKSLCFSRLASRRLCRHSLALPVHQSSSICERNLTGSSSLACFCWAFQGCCRPCRQP